jgi:sugar/nucleoside kinase (ribokinase family)
VSGARIAVVGHVEHVTLGRVDGLIEPGGVLHLTDTRFVPGGGGGIAFAQLCRSDAEIHLFTAVGSDEAGRAVLARISFDHAAAGGRGRRQRPASPERARARSHAREAPAAQELR